MNKFFNSYDKLLKLIAKIEIFGRKLFSYSVSRVNSLALLLYVWFIFINPKGRMPRVCPWMNE